MAKTAQERAQEALDTLNAKVAKLTERNDKNQAAAAKSKADLEAATLERDHVATHPALTQPTNGVVETGESAPAEPAVETVVDGLRVDAPTTPGENGMLPVSGPPF